MMGNERRALVAAQRSQDLRQGYPTGDRREQLDDRRELLVGRKTGARSQQGDQGVPVEIARIEAGAQERPDALERRVGVRSVDPGQAIGRERRDDLLGPDGGGGDQLSGRGEFPDTSCGHPRA